MKRRWLVNDCLGTIGGIHTLWHDLRDSCGCEDRTGGYTRFDLLANRIESDARVTPPGVIVRNATYFRAMDIPNCKTVSLVQDIATDKDDLCRMQADVIQRSDAVVFNSEYTRKMVSAPPERSHVIPIGVDLSAFTPPAPGEPDAMQAKYGIPPNCILFVGSGHRVKGFDLLKQFIDETGFEFCVVTKDGARVYGSRVVNLGPVTQAVLREIMVACSVLLCLSRQETQHLAGIEAAACGLPVVAPAVGCYYQLREHADSFGAVFDDPQDVSTVARLLASVMNRGRQGYDTRDFFYRSGFSRPASIRKWRKLLDQLESEE